MAKIKKTSEGFQTVIPYLIITNAVNFIKFTKKVFDASEIRKVMRADNTIMHAEIAIGGSTIMFSDSAEKYSIQTAGLFIYVNDADKIYKKAIKEGASVLKELSDQEYGRSGGVLDPFGNSWWITSVK